jgi:hypothetical protein
MWQRSGFFFAPEQIGSFVGPVDEEEEGKQGFLGELQTQALRMLVLTTHQSAKVQMSTVVERFPALFSS